MLASEQLDLNKKIYLKEKFNQQIVREHVAKILARENISVQHANIPTAMFDTNNRILFLPTWNDTISRELYLMLIGHEVGHALYTDQDLWDKEVTQKKNEKFKDIVNIFEDARIEKLIQTKYPGLRKFFNIGYKEVIEEKKLFDFNTPEADLIDRINLYFKVTRYSGKEVFFTEEEKIWLEKIDACKTFQDIINLSKEFHSYTKELEKQKQQNESQEQKESKDSNQPGSGEGKKTPKKMKIKLTSDKEGVTEDGQKVKILTDEDQDQKETSEDKENNDDENKNESKSNKKESKEKSSSDEESEDETEENSDGEENDDSEEGDGEENSDITLDMRSQNNKNSDTSDVPKVEVEFDGEPSQVQKLLEQAFGAMVNKAPKYDKAYMNLPTKLKTEEYIVDYKTVHKQIEQHYATVSSGIQEMKDAEVLFNKFKSGNSTVVNSMAAIFEMKKQALLHSRLKTSKTGLLNLAKVHTYRYNDDIFKKVTTLPQGKNHGLLMFIDLSSSMFGNIRGTYEQTLNLVLFCKKINIPFEVYGFTDRDPEKNGSIYAGHESGMYTSGVHGDMVFPTNFKLRNYLSSKMSPSEFRKACINMMALVNFYMNRNRGYYYTPVEGETPKTLPNSETLGSTPLNFCITGAINITRKFREDHKLDIVNTIFLTDGDATDCPRFVDVSPTNTGSQYNRNGLKVNYQHGYSNEYVIRDPISRKSWSSKEFESAVRNKRYRHNTDVVTAMLLEILRELCEVNAIGFYVADPRQARWRIGEYTGYNLEKEKFKKFRDDGFFYIKEADGYSNYYIIPGGDELCVDDTEIEITENATKSQINKAVLKALDGKTMSRVLLSKFIENIA